MRFTIEDAEYVTRVIKNIESGEFTQQLWDESAEYHHCDECGKAFYSILDDGIDDHVFYILKNAEVENEYEVIILIACEGFHQIDDEMRVQSY